MNADEAREAAGRATAYLDRMERRFREQGRELVNIDDGMHHGDPDLTAVDLRAVLDRSAELEGENARMREALRAQRPFLDGQVFVAGWYVHAEACVSLGWDQREAAWRKYREEMAETLAKAAPQQPAPTVAELHARFAHPGFEYATTQGPRKKWDQINDPPEGDGWERNIDAGRPGEGWERFDYHEESYWRRLRPAAICGFPSCGHPEHQAASDSKGGNEQ